MDNRNEELIACVKEMNEANYEINTLLLQEYRSLLDDEITTKQAIILEWVHKRGKLTVSEIAELMQVSSSAVSQIIGKLEKGGYVKREINLQNRREIFVLSGERGDAYFAKHEQVERSIVERFYTKLDFEEAVLLKNIMLKLKGIVEKELGVR
ncbi:MarR family transcriptional regulator [Paenibacillus hemerocallicola]|uniref:MarR family transcriptional regulator n=1 Tax=Paenibacillus hemerocallicola TaxID=1172614 RepID=A0A5C4SZV4_9BACL|nr:MarR family transcriptional regulator [Paenibacillus hemerocallicola]TNJ62332.1 MarR family transcriptional regulator [Paenibacillus hemerocallicola]